MPHYVKNPNSDVYVPGHGRLKAGQVIQGNYPEEEKRGLLTQVEPPPPPAPSKIIGRLVTPAPTFDLSDADTEVEDATVTPEVVEPSKPEGGARGKRKKK